MVNVNPDPHALEKMVSRRQITALLSQDNGNGKGSGNGKGNANHRQPAAELLQAAPQPAPSILPPDMVPASAAGTGAKMTLAEGFFDPNLPASSSAEAPASLPKRSINPIESDIDFAAKPAKSAKSAKKATVNLVADDQNKPTQPKKKGNGFLDKIATIAGITIKAIACVFLAGMLAAGLFVMFKKGLIKLPIGVGSFAQQQDRLPSVTGDWVIRYNEETSPKTYKYAVMAVQHGNSINGKGGDEHGDYYIAGHITPPATIELSKYYFAKGKPQAPIIFSGTFESDSQPLCALGDWKGPEALMVSIGKSSQTKEGTVQGRWKGNFFPNPDYSNEKIEPPVPLPPQTEPKPPSAKPASTKPTPAKPTHSAHPAKPTHPPKPTDPQGATHPQGPTLPQGPTHPSIFPGVENFGRVDQWGPYAAGGILIFCFALIFCSLKLFGPRGIVNKREKENYIPSQVKAQYDKILKEFAKPLMQGGVPLGQRCEWRWWCPWMPKDLSLPPSIRKNEPHMLIIGASNKGKSRFMAKMLSHDIEANDRAVVLIDSDGGVAELITRWISAHAKGKDIARRVVYLDPTSKDNTLGYNPLEMPEDEDLQSAASALVHGIKAIYTEPPGSQSQWNATTANILRNAAILLMVNGKTLTDLPALLNDNDFRDVLLESVEKRKQEKAEYITLLDTWGQYRRQARTDQWITFGVEPIMNRVGPMLGDARTRNILTKPVSDIRLRKIIEEKGILIVKVPRSKLDQNANLLGSFIVTGIKQAALSLANEQSEKQHQVALYLDELEHFVEKETVNTICSETEDLRIGLVGCIKTLQHLDDNFRGVLIAMNTICTFALARKDSELLGPQMFGVDGRKKKHQTVQNFFNQVNTSPQFEMVSDEKELNVKRLDAQEDRTFYCHKVGTVGVFHMRAHEFNDILDGKVNKKIIEKMRGTAENKKNNEEKESKKTNKASKEGKEPASKGK